MPGFLAAVVVGLIMLIFSADRFIGGAAGTARHFGVPPLLIGMVIVGFGTSAPELVVSVLAAADGSPGIAIGNAFGSNIANLSLILGITALVSPVTVRSRVLKAELPMLAFAMALVAWVFRDGSISRMNAFVLLAAFLLLMGWSIHSGMQKAKVDMLSDAPEMDALEIDTTHKLDEDAIPFPRSLLYMAGGFLVLLISSRILVWGAVGIASFIGVSDLLIGLTVVAVGTSLPELAASILAARKGEHDMAIGNIIGSNLFNTLAVVGLAGVIAPFSAGSDVLIRDIPVMSLLTVVVFLMGIGIRGPGRINRVEGGLLLVLYVAYTGWLVTSIMG